MSSSNATLAALQAIKSGSILFNLIWSYLMIILGIIGHSLSIYVFTRPKLRSNPTVCYFLASALTGLFVTCVNVPARLLQNVYYIDVFIYTPATCKILSWFLFWAKSQVSWFITLASIDRFMSSSQSATIRGWSSTRVVSRTIPAIVFIVGLIQINIPITYNINLISQKCTVDAGILLTFNGTWALVTFGLGPPIMMITFGALTIRNIQRSVRRIGSENIQTQTASSTLEQKRSQRQKIVNRQFIQMTIVQCVYFSLTTLLVPVQWIMQSVTSYLVSNAVQIATNNVLGNIFGFISITGACTSFYLFTLSSQLFRHELLLLFTGLARSNQQRTMIDRHHGTNT